MRKWGVNVAVVCAMATGVVALGACASTQSPGQQVDDAGITSRVKAKLTADPEINPFNIDVDADAGVVTLRGRVEDPEAKTEAERLARNTTGVVKVRNEIRVGERIGSGNPAPDQAIAAAIWAELAADTDVAAVNIDVDVQDGVVTLSGVVKTEMASQEAERVARNHDGVRSVRNQIQVAADGSGGGCAPCYSPKCKCNDCSCKESCCKGK